MARAKPCRPRGKRSPATRAPSRVQPTKGNRIGAVSSQYAGSFSQSSGVAPTLQRRSSAPRRAISARAPPQRSSFQRRACRVQGARRAAQAGRNCAEQPAGRRGHRERKQERRRPMCANSHTRRAQTAIPTLPCGPADKMERSESRVVATACISSRCGPRQTPAAYSSKRSAQPRQRNHAFNFVASA